MADSCSSAQIITPVGPARTLTEGPPAGATLVLGHGAGGGIHAPDLLAARDAALAVGLRVVRVEQPWRVSGRRVAEAAARLDVAWTAVLGGLEGPVVVGGRSAGARVACRTATATGAVAVLALAFPLRPPGCPERTRLPELLAPDVPRLVVQGDRDAFGVPQPASGVDLHVVAGADHAFAVRRADGRTAAQVAAEVRAVVAAWLGRLSYP
ncbi:MAG: alpha/beta family hydrolase [Mycobacteriales bacterium]